MIVLRALGALLAGVGAMLVVAFLPSTAWGTGTVPEPEPTSTVAPDPEPTQPEPSSEPGPGDPPPPSEPPPAPSTTEEPVVEPTTPPPDAPGVGTGVYVDPATGSVRVDENTGVAVGVAAFLLALTAGLYTSQAVLP